MPNATPVADRVTRAANPGRYPSPREVQDRLTAAVRAKNYDAMLELYHPDATVTSPDGTFHGPDEIRRYIQSQLEPFSGLEVVVEHKLDDGDVSADESLFVGTHTAELTLPTGETIAPTGRRVSQRSADVAMVRDGRVVSQRLYYDNADLGVQLGFGS